MGYLRSAQDTRIIDRIAALNQQTTSSGSLRLRRAMVHYRAMRLIPRLGHRSGSRLLLAIMAAALWAVGIHARSTAASGSTINLSDADNHRAVTLAAGDLLVVSLASTPGTGYGWTLVKADGKVLRQSGEPRLVPGTHRMPGAPETQVFRFVAAGAGSTVLGLDYVRPWEHQAAPARTFRVKVR